jgi:hypothetical protein
MYYGECSQYQVVEAKTMVKFTWAWVLLPCVIAAAVYGVAVWCGLRSFDGWAERGQMGDFFGGLANALALMAILVALWFQQHQLAETVKLQRELQQNEMVREYFRDGDSPEQYAARAIIYRTDPADPAALAALVGTPEAFSVIRFFHSWGMLVKHQAMPSWVFLETTTGDRVLQLHQRLPAHIAAQREANPEYANGFLYLVDGISKRRFEA